ncbi:hypothetical protein EVJ58_g8547 [Rhodofomes roseus]|uniref:DUF6532 domain-containing protein n=1 Tax=Rhodofomes roseus TaxID=34475 RepID=A0A4Y9Y056_9APHY|nr:hypothetical protein EVJ58_g8547 [Rhodofomes roseus]
MANAPRRKKKQAKKNPAKQGGSESTHRDASSEGWPMAHRGAAAVGPGEAAGNEHGGSTLQELQKELGNLKRTERDAYERAREDEIANPTITRPRAAKTQAYAARIWKPKKNDKRQLEDESPVDAPEFPVAPAVKRMRKDMPEREHSPDVVIRTPFNALTPSAVISNSSNTTQKALRSAKDSGLITTSTDHSHAITEDDEADEVEMSVVDGKTDLRSDCDELYETPAPAQKRTGRRVIQSSSDEETDDGEYESGAEPDDEEDFGVQSAAAFPSSRKVAKVAEQLKQGSAKLISTRKTHRPNEGSQSVSSDDLDGIDLAADFLEPGYVSDGPHNESGFPVADRAHRDDEEDALSYEDREEARLLPSPDDHWLDDKGRTWEEVVVHRAESRKGKGRLSEATTDTRKKDYGDGEHWQPSAATVETGLSAKNKKRVDSDPQTITPRKKTSEGSAKVKFGLGPKPRDPAVSTARVPATSTTKVAVTSRNKVLAGPMSKVVAAPMTSLRAQVVSKTKGLTTRVESREVGNDTQDIVSGGIGSESDQPEDGRDSDGPDRDRAQRANVSWPEDTDLTYTDRNKVAGLTSQTSPKIRALLKTTIAHELPRALALINAFPDVVERVQMFVDIFLDGTRRLGAEYNVIGQRVLQDTAYVQSLLVLPAKRMCTIRGPWYLACRDAVWEGYGLKAIEHDPVALKHGVEVLLHGGQFICPGKLVNDRYSEFKRDLPFCAETIIKLASILFLGPQAVRPLEDSCFTSSIKTGPESEQREIPPAMAALLATLAGAAIGEGLHGLRDHLKDGEGFIANQQERVYRGHLAALSTLHPLGRHKILGYIFKEAKAFHKRKSAAPTHMNMASTFLNPSTAGMDIDL